MSMADPFWRAPRIHGELLKLASRSLSRLLLRYMIRRRGRPGQSWTTFLRNYAAGIAAVDLFVVPTIGFKLLDGLVILGHGRPRLIQSTSFNSRAVPTETSTCRRGFLLAGGRDGPCNSTPA